jgi:hypothetical protein
MLTGPITIEDGCATIGLATTKGGRAAFELTPTGGVRLLSP